MKTKKELIQDIDLFLKENLGNLNIDKGQGRVNWKEDLNLVYELEQELHIMIDKLESIKLEDIK
tara:strand:+ start:532 stop:723 length:192 start_codon:yes stop_codon:yes gene_type:complete